MPGRYDRFETANVICVTLGKSAGKPRNCKASPRRRSADNKSARWPL